MMMNRQRAVVLVDGAYVFTGSKNLKMKPKEIKSQFRYEKFVKFLEQQLTKYNASLERRYFFNSVPDPATSEQNKFHSALKHQGWQTKLSGLKTRTVWCQQNKTKTKDKTKNSSSYSSSTFSHHSCPHSSPNGTPIRDTVQAGVDVHLATTMLTLAFDDQYDILVLVAGDGDFKDALNWISEKKHKKIILFGYSDSISSDLKQYVTPDCFFDLEKLDVWDFGSSSSSAPGYHQVSSPSPMYIPFSSQPTAQPQLQAQPQFTPNLPPGYFQPSFPQPQLQLQPSHTAQSQLASSGFQQFNSTFSTQPQTLSSVFNSQQQPYPSAATAVATSAFYPGSGNLSTSANYVQTPPLQNLVQSIQPKHPLQQQPKHPLQAQQKSSSSTSLQTGEGGYQPPSATAPTSALSPAPLSQFKEQLALLSGMGFTDVPHNLSLLVQHRGDVNLCVQALVEYRR